MFTTHLVGLIEHKKMNYFFSCGVMCVCVVENRM